MLFIEVSQLFKWPSPLFPEKAALFFCQHNVAEQHSHRSIAWLSFTQTL